MAREQQVMIRLTDEIKTDLQRYAANYGLSMSSLGAYIIGQWVYQQKKIVEPVVNSQGKQIQDAIEKQLGSVFESMDNYIQESIK